MDQVTQVNDTTVEITSSTIRRVSIDSLIRQRDFFQSKVDEFNAQIDTARGLGVITLEEKRTADVQQSGITIKNN